MSFITDFKRIFSAGFSSFRRSGVVSVASIAVISITMFIVGSLVLANATLSYLLHHLEDKVDVNVYFYPSAEEGNILSLKSAIGDLSEVDYVEYVSREDAYLDFKDRHKDDKLIVQSLEELGTNPLGAMLNIKAKETSQYETVANFLESDEALISAGAVGIIENVNYQENKLAIDRLTRLINRVQQFGFIATLIFILISLLVAFNTLRLGIFVSREEISIMRLVGAENKYIRGPFLVEGFLYGLISTLISVIAFYALLSVWKDDFNSFFGGFNLFTYFIENFWQFAALLLASGVVLGVLSAVFAIRGHLKK